MFLQDLRESFFLIETIVITPMFRLFLSITSLLTIFFSASTTVMADIYKTVDSNGTVYFTNAPITSNHKKMMNKGRRRQVKYDGSQSYKENYQQIIHKKARKYGIDSSLINAIIKIESNWNPTAVSQKGAIGLMQLMPSTALDMRIGNPLDPAENIEGGTKYLRKLLNLFDGELTLAIAAYNAGPETIKKYGGIPPYKETINYVKKVTELYSGDSYIDSYHRIKQRSTLKNTPLYKKVLKNGTILYTNMRNTFVESSGRN